MKKFLSILFFLTTISFPNFSQVFKRAGAGVTIIAHGWNPDASQPAWMQEMAKAIIKRSGGNGSICEIKVTGSNKNLLAICSNWNLNLTNSSSGEIVVLIDWSSVANHLISGVTVQAVAEVIAPRIYESQNLQPALSELPIHLIGHSRGGALIFELARLLGLQGIEVEHVTAIDPHPLTSSDPQGLLSPFGPGQTTDTPIRVYENILFVDNYWQSISYPKGQYILGAYNREWTSLPGGYHNESGYNYNILGLRFDFSDHLNTLLAYHSTIDLSTPVSNGQAIVDTVERNWFNIYESAGRNTGFKFSRIVLGDRKSKDIPVSSGDEIISGYHNDLSLGGKGARQSLIWTNAKWCNIIASSIQKDGTDLLFGNQVLDNGDALSIVGYYRSYSNACTVTFYVDKDRNPYNDNNDAIIGALHLAATNSTITRFNFNCTVSGLSSGSRYYVYSKITDGVYIRYKYFDYEFISSLVPDAAGPISGSTSVCQGQGEEKYSVAGISGALSYVWTLPIGATGTSTTNSITVNYGISSVSGNITVKGINACCDGDISILPITVGSKPQTPAISINGMVLHSSSSTGNQWYNRNGPINGAMMQDYLAITSGDYYVIVTTAKCNSDQSNIIKVEITGDELVNVNEEFRIYPNPTRNELHIETDNNAHIIRLQLFNSMGQVVFKGEMIGQTDISTSLFPPGVYLIRFEKDKITKVNKVVIR